jgi:pilus assembly protein Flp/PilA
VKENVMKKLMSIVARTESGVTAIEYGLIAGLVSVGIVGGLTVLGPKISAVFTSIGAVTF